MTDGQKLPNFESIAEILTRRGLASSAREAAEIIRAGKVSVAKRDLFDPAVGYSPLRLMVVTDPEEMFRYNEPVRVNEKYVRSGKKATRRQAAVAQYHLTGYDLQFLRWCGIAIADDPTD